MKSLSGYKISATDWRTQLRLNEKRTTFVIALFIFIYLAVGMLIDLYLHSGAIRTAYGFVKPILGLVFKELITFQIVPVVTLLMGGIAAISIIITFAAHDRLMLLGTEYHEVNPEHFSSPEEKQLYNVVEEMKTAASLRYMPKVYIIEADYMNAFASGYSEKSAMMAITRGLMQKLDRSELQAVMAHELSHIRHHDIKLTLTASVLSNLMLMLIDIMFYNLMYSRNRDRDNRLAALILLLRFLLPILTVVLLLYLSRTREYMADAGSVELTRDNLPLARALLKISQDYQSHSEQHGRAYVQTAHEDVRRAAYIFDPVQAGVFSAKSINSAFSTHPSLEDRLKALGVDYKEA